MHRFIFFVVSSSSLIRILDLPSPESRHLSTTTSETLFLTKFYFLWHRCIFIEAVGTNVAHVILRHLQPVYLAIHQLIGSFLEQIAYVMSSISMQDSLLVLHALLTVWHAHPRCPAQHAMQDTIITMVIAWLHAHLIHSQLLQVSYVEIISTSQSHRKETKKTELF